MGKTAVIEQIAAHHRWRLETVIASICDPTDFKGLPHDSAGRTEFSPPDWAWAMQDAGGGVVFLDEISTAPPSVQAALLRPVLGRVVGSLVLPSETRFVAAANPADIAAEGWELSAPLANRFLHLDWDVSGQVVSQGFAYGFDPIDVPTPDPAAVDAHREELLRAIGAFLSARPDLVHRMPDSSAEAGRAWPSPRSWEMGAVALAWARSCQVSEAARSLVLTAAVGASAAREFLVWEQALDLPNIERLLAGEDIALPKTPDKLLVVCGALVAAIKQNKSKARCDAAANRVLVAVCDQGHVDIATVALRRIMPTVMTSGVVLSPEAVGHFADMLDKMGKFGAGRR